MGDILGYGEFGLVVKAVWRDELSNRDMTVAVKTVKGKALIMMYFPVRTEQKRLIRNFCCMAFG